MGDDTESRWDKIWTFQNDTTKQMTSGLSLSIQGGLHESGVRKLCDHCEKDWLGPRRDEVPNPFSFSSEEAKE